MAKNEGTVTIPIDRYLELTKFVDDIVANKVIDLYSLNGHGCYTALTTEEILNIALKDNDDFARHNAALQKRIADFNSKPWYQRVFKSKV